MSKYIKGKVGDKMIMEHEIYMGKYILEIIKKEMKGKEIEWYKESRIRENDEGFIEVNYFLTEDYLLKTKTCKSNFEMKKYNRNDILKIEKEYSFEEDFGIDVILDKVNIYLSNEILELKRPNYNNNGDEKGFVKVIALL